MQDQSNPPAENDGANIESPLRCHWCDRPATGMVETGELRCEDCDKQLLYGELGRAEGSVDVLLAAARAALEDAHPDDVIGVVHQAVLEHRENGHREASTIDQLTRRARHYQAQTEAAR